MSSAGIDPEAIEPEDSAEHPTRDTPDEPPEVKGELPSSEPDGEKAGNGTGDESRSSKRNTVLSGIAQFVLSGFSDDVADWLVHSAQQAYDFVITLL